MKKKCYLHLGLHKTATSSFQQSCYKNKKYLEKFKIKYKKFICVEKKKDIINHSIPIFTLFCKDSRFYHVNINWDVSRTINNLKKSYQEQFDNLLNYQNILLSGEDISLLDIDDLERLVDYIAGRGFEICPFGLVRKPYSYLCSAVQENIKGGNYIPFVSLKFEKALNSFEFKSKFKFLFQANRIKKLKTLFGEKLSLKLFEPTLKLEYGPVGFLIENFLDLNPSEFKTNFNNQSKSNLNTRIQNLINKNEPKIRLGQINPNHYKVKGDYKDTKKFLLTKEEYKVIQDYLSDETDYFREIFGPNYEEEKIEFADNYTLFELSQLKKCP